jgi:hypothetical protein
MPGEPGVTVVTTLVCFFILHARLRAHLAPGIPCALYFVRGEKFINNSGASRRGSAIGCLKLESKIHRRRPGQAKRDPGPILRGSSFV